MTSLLDKIYEAGVVGCGGAGFPAHVKMNAKVEVLIVNGAECEPLLRTDQFLMRHKAAELIAAIDAVGSEVGAAKRVIALKKTYFDEIAALETAIRKAESETELVLLEHFYPAGDEQIMVLEVTGKTVPPGGIPGSVGAVVSNVGTMCGIWDALQDRPVTHKYLTVTGEVEQPLILRVPVGTAVTACVDAAVPLQKEYGIVLGGPMMGKAYESGAARDQVVTKTTSGIIVLSEAHRLIENKKIPLAHTLNRAKAACIQCMACTESCPRYLSGHPLEPHKIMRRLACGKPLNLAEDEVLRQALICSECGVCEVFACPMGLQPRRVNQYLKGELAGLGIRYERSQESYAARCERDFRRVPSQRLAARTGVLDYYHCEIDTLKCVKPEFVKIPLKQHIGVPTEPLVKPGDQVTEGQLIGSCERERLGANVHASVTGVVEEVSDCVVIRRGSGIWKR